MKGESICWYCEEPLKLLNAVKLGDGKKICPDCHSLISSELSLNLLTSRRITVDEIDERFADIGRDYAGEMADLIARKEEIRTTGIYLQVPIDIASGAAAVKAPNQTTIVQLNDNRIAINPDNPEFYYLIDREFDGPSYRRFFSSPLESGLTTEYFEQEPLDNSRKIKYTVAGGVIGTLFFPFVGTVIGAVIGAKLNNKKQKKELLEQKRHQSRMSKFTEDIEVKSLAKITLLRVFDHKKIILTINADTKDYNEILSLQLSENSASENAENKSDEPFEDGVVSREDAIDKLKEIKELVDLGILTSEEFEEKKKLYMDYI